MELQDLSSINKILIGIGLPELTETRAGTIPLPKQLLQETEIDWAGFVPLQEAERRIAKYQKPVLQKEGHKLIVDVNSQEYRSAKNKLEKFLQLLSYKKKYKDTGLSVEDAFVKDIVGKLYSGYSFSSKLSHESIGKEYGITDTSKLRELIEFASMAVARGIIAQGLSIEETYAKIVSLYSVVPYSTNRTSTSELLSQFSTALPHAYLMSRYAYTGENDLMFEPTCGNGNLCIAFNPAQCVVNELDKVRLNNLYKLPYKEILNQDALKPFPFEDKIFDSLVTNPPFGQTKEAVQIDGAYIYGLEQQIVCKALQYCKDNVKAAIICGGTTEFDEKGRLKSRKDGAFLGYLWSRFNVEDVMQITGNLYRKMGTTFSIRIILINGRKPEPNGYFPLEDKTKTVEQPFSTELITSFAQLMLRFKPFLPK